MRRRNVQAALAKQRAEVINMAEEQLSLESVLDRSAQLYRQAHAERRQMVATWKEAVQSMRSRDRDIGTYEKDLDTAKAGSVRRNRQLKEQMEFLEQQLQNNRETERLIAHMNEELVRCRHDLNECTEDVTLRTNDFLTMKKLTQTTTNQLHQQRHKNRQAAKEQVEMEAANEQAQKTYAELREKFERFQGRRFNAQERLKHLDDLVEVQNTYAHLIILLYFISRIRPEYSRI